MRAPVSPPQSLPRSPLQEEIRKTLHDIFVAKEEVLRSYYFDHNLGALSVIQDRAMQDQVGYLQWVLNRNSLLGLMRIFDARDTRYTQLTIEGVITALPIGSSEYNGMEHAGHLLKLRKPTPAKIRSRLLLWLKKIRKRPYFLSMTKVRHKMLAHSQSLAGIQIGPIRGRNLLRLIQDTEWFVHAVNLLVLDLDPRNPPRPTHYGQRVVAMIQSGALNEKKDGVNS